MSFWETHRGALTATGVVLFLLLATYLAFVRPAIRESEEARASIENLGQELVKFYPTLGSEGASTARQPLSTVRAGCQLQQEKYRKQIEAFKGRLRFTFEDFKYLEIPPGTQYPGEWLSKTYSVVKDNVQSRCYEASAHGRAAPVLNPSGWLGFKPSENPVKVTKAEAEEELRKLCLAERASTLAIESEVSQIIRVEPQNRVEEGASFRAPNPAYRPGSNLPPKIIKEYDNRFIVNYPVSITLTGSLDSVMRFINKVRQKLVIRHFRIVGREELAYSGVAMRPGEVQLVLSAAYMDFRAGEVKQAPPPPKYVVPAVPPD